VIGVYVIFNFAVVFICSWLYLQGGRKIRSFFSPTSRRNRKEMRKRHEGDKA
jgi:ATP-binding cassette, subfamily G (WHITE), member 2, SNQ2